jgi:site-specific recombinase XerC
MTTADNAASAPLPDPDGAGGALVFATAPPGLVAWMGERGAGRTLEFLTAHLRNAHTRRLPSRGGALVGLVRPSRASARKHSRPAAHFEELARGETLAATAAPATPLAPQTVKQHLAALRHWFDDLVLGHVLEMNPAHVVHGPRSSRASGKTPVLDREDAKKLLACIDTSTVTGARAQALIALMVFFFARIGAVVGMKVREYRRSSPNSATLTLHEKGGKFHRVPAHHAAIELLDRYMALGEPEARPDAPLWQSSPGHAEKLSGHALSPRAVENREAPLPRRRAPERHLQPFDARHRKPKSGPARTRAGNRPGARSEETWGSARARTTGLAPDLRSPATMCGNAMGDFGSPNDFGPQASRRCGTSTVMGPWIFFPANSSPCRTPRMRGSTDLREVAKAVRRRADMAKTKKATRKRLNPKLAPASNPGATGKNPGLKKVKGRTPAPKARPARSSSSGAITPKQVVASTTAGGAALLAARDPGTVPFLLLFGAFGVALSLGVTLALETFRPAARAFGKRLAEQVAPAATDERSAASILRRRVTSNASAQRAVLDGVRRLLDSVAEEVAHPLADLTAEYVNDGKFPDAFFRGTARFLGDASADELSMLQEFLQRASTDIVIEGREEVPFMYRPLLEDRERLGPNHLQYLRTLPEDDPKRPTTRDEWADLGVLASGRDRHIYRVIQQLKLNGLADDPPRGGFTGVSGKESLVVMASVLRRLARLLSDSSRGN